MDFKAILDNYRLKLIRDLDTIEYAHVGVNWYANVNRQLAREFPHISILKSTAVFSLCSVRCHLSRNYVNAYNALRHDFSGLTYTKVMQSKIIGAALTPDNASYNDLRPYFGNGLKTLAFWDNLANPHTSTKTTIDVWMARYIGIPQESLTPKRYDALSEVTQKIASYYGLLPLHVQAIIWIKERGSAH